MSLIIHSTISKKLSIYIRYTNKTKIYKQALAKIKSTLRPHHTLHRTKTIHSSF